MLLQQSRCASVASTAGEKMNNARRRADGVVAAAGPRAFVAYGSAVETSRGIRETCSSHDESSRSGAQPR
jgi:hypothetical protein